jgi:nucleotide-binding universal stress UspA family protein
MKNLLVAHNFDDTSERALDRAIALAGKLSAKVTVVHVYSVPIYTFPEGSALIPSPEDAARIAEAAQRHLDNPLARRRAEGVDVQGALRCGVPSDEICKLADEVGADMIVIGTHGRSVLGRAFFGSVAEIVVRTAKQPVMTVHSAGGGAE